MTNYLTNLITEHFKKQEEEKWKSNLETRLSELEQYTYRTRRKEVTTQNQQLLILEDLGVLPIFQKLKISKRNQAELLAILLNTSATNVRKAIEGINTKDSPVKSAENYKFLYDRYKEIGLTERLDEIESHIVKKIKQEEAKNKK